MAYTRLGKSHVPGESNGTHHAFLLLQHQYGLQIVLTRRMNFHTLSRAVRPCEAYVLRDARRGIVNFLLHLCRHFLLCIPHSSVLSILRQKFLMCASFSNFSVRHHKNLSGVLNDRKRMGNHDNRFLIFQEISDCLFYRQLILNIQGCCGLI